MYHASSRVSLPIHEPQTSVRAAPTLRAGRPIGHDPIGMNKLEPVLTAEDAESAEVCRS